MLVLVTTQSNAQDVHLCNGRVAEGQRLRGRLTLCMLIGRLPFNGIHHVGLPTQLMIIIQEWSHHLVRGTSHICYRACPTERRIADLPGCVLQARWESPSYSTYLNTPSMAALVYLCNTLQDFSNLWS